MGKVITPLLHNTPVRIFDRTYKVFGCAGEGWFNILRNTGTYQEFNLDNLRPFIAPDSICLDVGANLGMMTLAMAQLAPKGMVYAFEPDVSTFAALKMTIAESKHQNVLSYPFVMGTEGACGTFVEDKEWRSSSHFIPGEGPDCQHSIDGFNLERVDLIKIDVEGAEIDVLTGAMETLHRCRPIVIMEFNTFAFVHYRDIIPRDALDCIFKIFSKVEYFEKRVGRRVRLDDREAFLRNNFLAGLVDDLVCSW